MPFKQFPLLVGAFAGAAAVYFALPVATVGFVFLVLYPTRLRLLGALPILICLPFIGQAEPPSLHMFGRDLIVVRDNAQRLITLRRRGHVYELQRIEAFHGQSAEKQTCRPSCRISLSDIYAGLPRPAARFVGFLPRGATGHNAVL